MKEFIGPLTYMKTPINTLAHFSGTHYDYTFLVRDSRAACERLGTWLMRATQTPYIKRLREKDITYTGSTHEMVTYTAKDVRRMVTEIKSFNGDCNKEAWFCS